MVKSRLKKSVPECPFECGGGGGKCYLGNAQIEVASYGKGLPLTITHTYVWGMYSGKICCKFLSILSSKNPLFLFREISFDFPLFGLVALKTHSEKAFM